MAARKHGLCAAISPVRRFCSPSAGYTAVSEASRQRFGPHNPLVAALTGHVPGPPILSLLGDVRTVHTHFPSILPSLTLASKGNRNDLVSEADADDPYMLSLRRRSELADKVDQRRDERVGSVVCGVFFPSAVDKARSP